MNSGYRRPLISVLMPTYNCAPYLDESIASILNQSYEHFEFLILDDGSTDESQAKINSYAQRDKRIRVYHNSKNLGIAQSRNRLLKSISDKSQYFAMMDSDDISLPTRLEEQFSFLEKHKQFIGCGAAIEYFWENSQKQLTRYYQQDFDEIKKSCLIKSPLPQGCMMLNVKIISAIGYYDERYEVCEDWDYWFRVLKQFKITNLDKVLYLYRQRRGQSKEIKLKLILINRIKIKLKYIEFKNFMNLRVLFRLFMEIGILFLPKPLILWLLAKVEK